MSVHPKSINDLPNEMLDRILVESENLNARLVCRKWNNAMVRYRLDAQKWKRWKLLNYMRLAPGYLSRLVSPFHTDRWRIKQFMLMGSALPIYMVAAAIWDRFVPSAAHTGAKVFGLERHTIRHDVLPSVVILGVFFLFLARFLKGMNQEQKVQQARERVLPALIELGSLKLNSQDLSALKTLELAYFKN